MSQHVGTILDVEDVIPGDGYTLEVSSPGVERKLTRPLDFERFSARKSKFVLREPVENQRRWEGTLGRVSPKEWSPWSRRREDRTNSARASRKSQPQVRVVTPDHGTDN